jgi:hypothetical protein
MGKRQMKIPGTEQRAIKEIDAAAERYVEARDARMELTEKEVELRDRLVDLMRKHKLEVYRDDDAAPPLLVLLIVGKDKVKVRRESDEAEAEAGD